MLSDSDISRYLGKNIGIYPINEENFEGSCIELTASDLAWSLSTKKKVSSNGCITIPSHDSVLIISNETIFLDKKFAGYCISKVSIPSFGIISTSAPVKPNWIGKLLITMHNLSERDYILKVGEEFAILTIHKLQNKSKKIPLQPNARTDLLSRHGIQLDEKDTEFLAAQANGDPQSLFKLIKRDPAYQEFKNNLLMHEYIVRFVIYCVIFLVVYFVVGLLPGTSFSESIMAGIISTFIYDSVKNRR